MSDQTRNLNPTPEARLAMAIWSSEYASQGGGTMDFWDTLSEGKKNQARELLAQVVEAHTAQAVERTQVGQMEVDIAYKNQCLREFAEKIRATRDRAVGNYWWCKKEELDTLLATHTHTGKETNE